MHHHEEGLLKRVSNLAGFTQKHFQRVFYFLGRRERAINAFANIYDVLADSSLICWIGQQVYDHLHHVKVEDNACGASLSPKVRPFIPIPGQGSLPCGEWRPYSPHFMRGKSCVCGEYAP